MKLEEKNRRGDEDSLLMTLQLISPFCNSQESHEHLRCSAITQPIRVPITMMPLRRLTERLDLTLTG